MIARHATRLHARPDAPVVAVRGPRFWRTTTHRDPRWALDQASRQDGTEPLVRVVEDDGTGWPTVKWVSNPNRAVCENAALPQGESVPAQ
jgi:hypothetical protein